MFKEAIKSATSKIFKKTKSVSGNIASGALQEFISVLGSRVPGLENFSNKIIGKIKTEAALNTLRAEQQKSFVESEQSKDMSEAVKKELPEGADKKLIDKTMKDILSKITKLVDKEGMAEAKKSDIYKKYESYFSTFQKHIAENSKKKEDKKSDSSKIGTPGSGSKKGTSGPVGDESSILADIETNTKETAEVLKMKAGTEKEKGPVTILSVLDRVGGSILDKVFSQKTIEKLSSKISDSSKSKTEKSESIIKTDSNSSDSQSEKSKTEKSESIIKTDSEKSVRQSEKSRTDKVTESEKSSTEKSSSVKTDSEKFGTNSIFEKNSSEKLIEAKIEAKNNAKADSTKEIVDELKKIAKLLEKKEDSKNSKSTESDSLLDRLKDRFSRTRTRTPGSTRPGKTTPSSTKPSTSRTGKTTPGSTTPGTSRISKIRAVLDKINPFSLSEPEDLTPDVDIDRKETDPKKNEPKKSNRPNRKARRAAALQRKLNPVQDTLKTVAKDSSIIPELNKTPVPSTTPKVPGGKVAGTSRFGSLLSKVGSGISRLGSGAASIGARLAPGAMSYGLPALGVAAAGAAGYGAGTVLNSGITAGITAATGKENTLGTWLQEKFGKSAPDLSSPVSDKEMAAYKASPKYAAELAARQSSKAVSTPVSTPAPKLESEKINRSALVTEPLNKQETINSEKSKAPIIVTTNNVSNSSGTSGQPSGGMIVGSPIRNQESSFERVQMQDYWPRAK